MMLETAAYLGASLFFGSVVLYIHRTYKKAKQIKQKPVAIPLRTNRTLLLEQQRQLVTDRRNRLKSVLDSKPPERTKPPKETRPAPTSEEPIENGFGEDLGSALSLDQNSTISEKVKSNQSVGRSRFAALQDAADQFKEMYNRNRQL